MKKVLLSFLGSISICAVVTAQDVNAGIKFLYYERFTSAKQTFQKLIAANPKDAQAIYWLGQTYIMNDQLDSAKTTYQNGLNAGVNDPYLWVGSGEVDILQGGDVNAAKQKFEQAITATTATKGKNKGNPDPNILDAIGRAMAAGSSTQGDANYGIDKLKQAAQLDPKNADIFINLGLCYRKLGGEHGGEAVTAYQQAIAINGQNARAYYLTGRIYETQRNKESMDEWYGKAISADPAFAPVYLQYFLYYSEKDVTTAKGYLDKYVANADKDCKTDFFVGNYLFRAGKYQESLQQAKNMETNGCGTYSRINVLYAYNYDRLGDSLQAKSYIQKYFSLATPDEIQPPDYAFAGTVYAKFPEMSDTAVTYLKKAVELDTVKEEQQKFMTTASDIAAKSGNYAMILGLLQTSEKLNGGKLSETQYFNLSKGIVDAVGADSGRAFDTARYSAGYSVIQSYITAYPDKPQGYSFLSRYAKLSDKDTTKGLAIAPLQQYNEFLAKDTAAGNKKTMFSNDYYMLIYYAQYAKDAPKEQEYQRAIDITSKMKTIYTDPSSEEYQFADKTGKQLQASLDKYNKSKTGGGTSGGKSQK
ncbi:MAG: tetratricopeptide repeat protein [Parafilimonas sp.]|nr:tetratricopeptide repeat protein [Parafilimonas sp.]